MKKLLLLFLALPFVCFAADVTFHLTDFTQVQTPFYRRTLLIDPLSAVMSPDSNITVVAERRYYNLGTNPTVTVTNMVYGSYLVTLWGNTQTSLFRIYIPDTNGAINAASYITGTGNNLLLSDGTYLRLSP